MESKKHGDLVEHVISPASDLASLYYLFGIFSTRKSNVINAIMPV
jgi:hypothetical protein